MGNIQPWNMKAALYDSMTSPSPMETTSFLTPPNTLTSRKPPLECWISQPRKQCPRKINQPGSIGWPPPLTKRIATPTRPLSQGIGCCSNLLNCVNPYHLWTVENITPYMIFRTLKANVTFCVTDLGFTSNDVSDCSILTADAMDLIYAVNDPDKINLFDAGAVKICYGTCTFRPSPPCAIYLHAQ